MPNAAGTSVVMLVQNLPVPFDRRVWQEALALTAAGYDVTVICPMAPDAPAADEVREGVTIRRYRPLLEGRSLPGYLLEYAVALAAMTRLLHEVRRTRDVSVVHICNPPDLLFLVALPLVLLRRIALVFDHHDVTPELMVAKGRRPDALAVRLLRLLERLTFAACTVSIATNESYRRVALGRGRMRDEDVFVVRSGPDLDRLGRPAVDDRLRQGRRHLVGYVGVMGRQDGLDVLLDAARILVHEQGRDVHFALAGSGPELRRLQRRARALDLDGHVTFHGRLGDERLFDLIATADVCVSPDEVNAMNDMSTMNKVVEYMALGKPLVQFDLHEGRVSAGGGALYAAPDTAQAFADAVAHLLDDPELRGRMSAIGARRYREHLAWSRQVPALLAAYDRALAKVFPRRRSAPGRLVPMPLPVQPNGHPEEVSWT